MADWKFQRRQGSCSACEKEFEDGERHLSALIITESDLVREDRCLECWEQREEKDEEQLIWWATRHQPKKKKTFVLDLESLERVFLRLDGREEQQIRELRYVLCLLLMRKRRLKLERVLRGEDAERLLLKRPKHEERYEVEVFDFTPERIDELRGQLAEVFEGFDPDEDGEKASEEPAAESSDEELAEENQEVDEILEESTPAGG